jgi:NADH-quinone oxidoreductase subunit E
MTINEILKKHPKNKDSLISILQSIQESLTYISEESIVAISKYLNIPISKIYAVASFYNQFKFKAPGKYHIQVCRGTACHVKGSKKLLDFIKEKLNINENETRKDKLFSLETVACVGACSLAPVVVVNGKHYPNMDEIKIEELFNHLANKN